MLETRKILDIRMSLRLARCTPTLRVDAWEETRARREIRQLENVRLKTGFATCWGRLGMSIQPLSRGRPSLAK